MTGAAGALGSAIATRLACDGSTVVMVDTNGERAELKAKEISAATGSEVAAWTYDVSSAADNYEIVERVGETFGRLDQLVNNAAINLRATDGNFSEQQWSSMMAVNLWGPASLCQTSEDLWRKGGGGSVVNISSRTWLTGGPLPYVASKAGIVGLTRALAVRLAPLGVTVNAVAPSTVVTPFVRNGRSREELDEHLRHHREISLLPRLATPEDVAGAVGFLASRDAGYITGEVLHVAGGGQLAPPP